MRLADAPSAEELEQERAMTRLARGSLFRRVPRSAVRLELGDLAGQWTIISMPAGRPLEHVIFEYKSTAELVLSELSKQLAKQRRHMTRPFGTCPQCSNALEEPAHEALRNRLDRMGWCATCARYVIPAGTRT